MWTRRSTADSAVRHQIPSGYRDWKLIAVAHEKGDLNSFASMPGNDAAISAKARRAP